MPRQGTTPTTPPLAGSSPDAVSWRLSQVEFSVKETQAEIKSARTELLQKIDSITAGFATHKDIEVAKEQAKLEHDAIYEKISDVETQVKGVKKEVKDIRTRNWIQNTLSAVLGSILTFLLLYFLNNIAKG